MIGCTHNLERVVVYPEQKPVKRTIDGAKISMNSFVSGQYLNLICPYGCSDVVINLEEHPEE